MRWYKSELFKMEQIGTNKLGTPITEPVSAGFCMVRQAPVSPELKAIEGNNAHVITRSFITRKPARDFEGVRTFEFRGREFRLIDISNSIRGTIITGTYSKPGDL